VRLAEIPRETFETAVHTYLEEAWGPERIEERWPTDVLSAGTAEAIVDQFEDETRRRGEEGLRRHVMRLGNPVYPHMKLVLQEVLIPGEFFFSVDTHDQMEIDPGLPGFDAWMTIKVRNMGLKGAIETRWREHPDVPTTADLLRLIEPPDPDRGVTRVLVVDDEVEIADVVAAVLASEGYAVQQAYDGEQALAAVGEFEPELLVMDYQMPGLDGIEVCRALKSEASTREIPIVLATASMTDLTVFGTLANGFLMKPYNRDFLVGFVRRLVPPRTALGEGN
jgi:CheY-like chemotaxis protein